MWLDLVFSIYMSNDLKQLVISYQMPSYQSNPHNSTHQSSKAPPPPWNRINQSTSSTGSVVRGAETRNNTTATTTTAGSHDCDHILRSVYLQNRGWATQVASVCVCVCVCVLCVCVCVRVRACV